ncbi:MAG: AAA family ATPase [Saprospiraceae bacterium]
MKLLQNSSPATLRQAANYLFDELSQHAHFTISEKAGVIAQAFQDYLRKKKVKDDFLQSITALNAHPVEQFQLALQWLKAYEAQVQLAAEANDLSEAAYLLLNGQWEEEHVSKAITALKVPALSGEHPLLDGKEYVLHYTAFLRKLTQYQTEELPQYYHFQQRKKELVQQYRNDLRLAEFEPKVLTSFVRNKLIDEVYLSLLGDNLAKQIGTVGAETRTDRMGLLLLLSPPGYGKTTLMEYIANRMGLIFMKINGPAIGHKVVTLDPLAATDRSAQKELEKLNLALEMGDNVMIYIDDIQHCHQEFLQKFISLCDAQRKIEGVWKGQTKTYDLKGKRVCVVMAGNPYTESGERFQVPDMLANRADIYNLGDLIGDNAKVFKLSYIENAMTSNAILARLATKSMEDVYQLVEMLGAGEKTPVSLKRTHTPEELNEYSSVLQKLIKVREVILNVNKAYIQSAGMADAHRTEPPFKLQGSYRNMNKIAEKIVPIMNENELQTLLLSHYEGEAQTLTHGAESNMLKLKEMMGVLSAEEHKRWQHIVTIFQEQQQLHGANAQNPVTQVAVQMNRLNQQISQIRENWKG